MPDRTVSTVAELDALPDRAVLRDLGGFVWQKGLNGWDGTDGSHDMPAAWLERVVAPLTVLVAEQLPPEHLHDWRLAAVTDDGWFEKCLECGERRQADYR